MKKKLATKKLATKKQLTKKVLAKKTKFNKSLKQRLIAVSKDINVYYEKQALGKDEIVHKLKDRMLKLKGLLEKGTDALESALMSGKNTFERELAYVATILKELKQTSNTLGSQAKEASITKIDKNTKYAVELVKLALKYKKKTK